MRKIVREAFQINNSSAIAVDATMQDKSPSDEFVIGVNVPEMIWFPHIVHPPLYSVSPSYGTVNRVNSF